MTGGVDVVPEIVRGRLTPARAEAVLGLWERHGVLGGEIARRRLDEVVAVAVDRQTGEVVGVNSVTAQRVPLVGGYPFWVYRRFIPADPGWAVGDAMLDAALGALEAEHEPDAGGPVGLCVFVDDPEVMRQRRAAVWAGTQLAYAGYTPDGRQVRVRYFEGARIV